MTSITGQSRRPGDRKWRVVRWGVAGALLMVPLAAMQLTAEMNWTLLDFVFFGGMLAIICGSYEVLVRQSSSLAYRAGGAIALAAAFLLVWVNVAVGVIGDEDNPANLMFVGVLAIGIVGAAAARLRAAGLAWTLATMAVTQAAVAAIAMIFRLGEGEGAWPLPLLGLSVCMIGAWLLAAGLFRYAARA